MRKLIHLLSLLIIIGCEKSESKKDKLIEPEPIKTEKLIESEPIQTDTIENLTNNEIDTLTSNFQINSIVEEDDFNPEDYRRESLNLSFKQATLYNLHDTIKADFNGDGAIDKAFYVEDNETSGIIIIHGKTNEEVRNGFGQQFAHMTEFDWVDYWGLVKDSETSEVTFTEEGEMLGSKDVELQNHSIVLGKDEVGGGLITYLDGKYVWIHQTC